MVNRKRFAIGTVLMAACLGLTGCLSLEVGSDLKPPRVKARGLVNGHVTATGLEEWDNWILRVGVLGNTMRAGEIASVDVWPLAGVGVGLVGARLRLLPLEAGVGVIGYDPKPVKPQPPEDDGEDDESPDQGEGEDGGENKTDAV